jgi:predicted DNA-binding transcriptional regulator YafY
MPKLGVRTVTSRKDEARYEPARRLQEVRTMLNSADGVSVYDIAERLDICVRTALRYLQALEAAGEPLTEEMDGKRKLWKLIPNARHEAISFTTTQMLALSLSRRVFDFLAGTGIKDDLDDVFAKVEATLKRRDFLHAKNLDRKLFDINEAPHVYEGRNDHVNDIMTALINEERLRVTHGSVAKWGKTFVVEPYTLIVYKKGLYLAGFSHYHQAIRTFSLDGFREVDRKKGDKFEYPADYHPAQLSQGAFGIIGGQLTHVRIRFDHDVARFVRRRRWHPTQQLKQVGHGDLELTMEVNGTTEVFNWVMEWADKAEVLEPERLRDEVATALARAAARYHSKPAN